MKYKKQYIDPFNEEEWEDKWYTIPKKYHKYMVVSLFILILIEVSVFVYLGITYPNNPYVIFGGLLILIVSLYFIFKKILEFS